jgi:hypothetical protein
MANFADEYFLALAAATPLPAMEDGEREKLNDIAPGHRPGTRSHARPLLKLQVPVFAAPVVETFQSKKRKPNFTIFVDADAAAASNIGKPISTPKRSRTGTPRTPLSDRTHSTNSTPAPSPRLPDTPFSLSNADPYWENLENYSPFFTPATSPATPSPTSRPSTPSARPPPPPPPSTRVLRPRANRLSSSSSSAHLLPPTNTILYTMLGLETWRVDAATIQKSYRRMAGTLHPDKASSPGEKQVAHLTMQQLNAARDVLLDKKLRAEYHRTGIVPWVV